MIERERVLIVEDDEINALITRRYLEKYNYQVVGIASNGLDAIELTKDKNPEIVLMDIKIQGDMDGIMTADKIIRQFDVPVIYLTAYTDDNTLERAKRTKPYGYIIKPIEERELYSTIQMAFYKFNMEEKLIRTERKFKTLFNQAADAIFIFGLDEKIVELNHYAESILEYSKKDLIDRRLEEVRLFNRNGLFGGLIESRERGRSFYLEAEMIDAKGKTIPVELNSQIIEYFDREVIMCIARDISERKKAEIALENLNMAMNKTVQALSTTLELRDPYTAGHQQRVARLACAIGEELGFSQDRIEGIRIAGILHDIGKINVPAEILTKPGRLNELEMEMIKQHPLMGYDIIKDIPFPWPIAEIVLQHHERIDGSGYLRGLKKSEILMEARVLAVADVVEAMSSHRPYRAALGMDIALEEIEKNKEKLYDGDVVEACVNAIKVNEFRFPEK